MAKRCSQCSQRPGKRYTAVDKHNRLCGDIVLCPKCLKSRTSPNYYFVDQGITYYPSKAEATHAQVTTALMQHM